MRLNNFYTLKANSIKLSLNTDYYHMNLHANEKILKLKENDIILNSFQLISIFQYEFQSYKKV